MHLTLKGATLHMVEIMNHGGLAVLQERWYGWHVSEYISHCLTTKET